MENNRLDPKEALKNKAFAKNKPNAESFGNFKVNLARLIDLIDEKQDENFHKNLFSDFLKKTYYEDQYFINVKEKSDLVIHNGKNPESTVGVIFETKKPTKTNNIEMLKVDDLNKKAFQQLVLYFLRERIVHKNLEIKYLVVTNFYEWFIFDARIFEKLFAQNRELVQTFTNFEKGQLSGDKTDFFYQNIAKPAIASIQDEIKFTHFDLRDYQVLLKTAAKKGDQKLEDLYKLFSPDYLLKLTFANDSNSLNKPFYNELLYIIGLTETKEGGKKLIGRTKEGDRNSGSLIENAISQILEVGKISREETQQLFDVALNLALTWINRVLFLKLLEAQLIKYHRGDQDFAFLNSHKIKNYSDLKTLFFSVLALDHQDRTAIVKEKFANVPYLNSSLFERTKIENDYITISDLESNESLPIFGATVLKDSNGKRRSGDLNALEYLLEFLRAYDFSSDESEDDQEDSEKLINAAVLGRIFEKINGYKDGSFYTPSFITMYMCRETIRRSLVQKFNEIKGWNCENLDQLYEKITDKKEANTIINSLKICDPAVGSGHFLVSALNEIIAIKSELKVLLDRSGKSLKDYRVEVRNDKLLVYDDEGKLFEYFPNNSERQRVQEALFHEKQTIIEGCLFGVDINANSVIICRLRLWIELLKNAYYRADGNLETLPNIDINIKEGNSLISRFGINKDLGLSLKSNKNKSNVTRYKESVKKYFNAKNKDDKKTAEKEIIDIKESFRSVLLGVNSPLIQKRNEIQLELNSKQLKILGTETNADKKAYEKRQKKLEKDLIKINVEIEEVNNEKFYRKNKAFEWQLEFPEVLNNDGDFVGFDVVIGNPPYGVKINRKESPEYSNFYSEILTGEIETYIIFYFMGLKLLNKKGKLAYITPDSWLTNSSAKIFRNWLQNNFDISDIFDYYKPITDAKDTRCHSLLIEQKNTVELINIKQVLPANQNIIYRIYTIKQNEIKTFQEEWRLYVTNYERILFNKMEEKSEPLEKNYYIKYGLRTGDNKKYVSDIESIYPLIAGADISTLYAIEYKPKYLQTIDYLPQSYFNEHFYQEKIIIQRIRTNSLNLNARWLECAYILGGYIPMDSLSYVYQKYPEHDIKYLLSILNSKLMNKYYRSYYTDVNVKPKYLSQLPIPDITINNQQQFIKFVDQIHAAKKSDPKADTTTLEKEIDQLVYQLYGLTEEEIKIVEGGK